MSKSLFILLLFFITMPNLLDSSSSDDSPASKSASPSHSSSSSSPSIVTASWNHLFPLLTSLSKELPNPNDAESEIRLPSRNQKSSRSCPAQDPKLNFRPVIGILSHPGDGASGRLSNSTNASYIAASYVKFVESAGARGSSPRLESSRPRPSDPKPLIPTQESSLSP
uniref:Uncharacterized protein n=1 Tax=Kalanchoe fedtschenkoi TaxID=63787 RepID=A0A7N0U5X6_KALFE